MSTTGTHKLRVDALRFEAPDILSLELVDPECAELPAFDAGAHVDLHLPSGLLRSYSIASSPSERSRYVLGVHRTPASRGGSSWIHESLRPGALVDVSDPLNNFALDETAEISVLIAGGIGITPMLSMAHQLSEAGKPWVLHYAVRDRALLAFGAELEQLGALPTGRVEVHVDAEHDGAVLDLDAVVARADDGAHLYCCGPTPMIEAFQRAAAGRDPGTVHVEYFSSDVEADTSGGFEIVLQRSEKTIQVEPGCTILQAMLDAGVDVPYSCSEGICGTCETGVLEGVPEHRDMVLTDSEKAANDVIFVCCSGSRSPRLVLDA